MASDTASKNLRPYKLPKPDLSSERIGNTGTPGVWHFESGVPGTSVMLGAIIHGNELCGAWALKKLLESGLRPRRGSLTVAFCNLAAFDTFKLDKYPDSRFVDEDMNRVWSDDKLEHPGSIERSRAAQLLPWVKQADWLMDFHSMSNSDEPLQLTGLHQRNIELALSMGAPRHIIADAGHAAGVRMRDYGRFGEPGENGTRSLLIECGFHGDPDTVNVALDQMGRFLAKSGSFDRRDIPAEWLAPDSPEQQALRVTHAITASGADFRFAQSWKSLQMLSRAGELIGWDSGTPVLTPYENCVLIMPSLANLRAGVTVVRLAQPI